MQKQPARQFHILSFAAALFMMMGLFASTSVLAVKPPKDPPTEIDIREAFADQESGTLVLIGGTFISPVVTFGDDQVELTNIIVTEAVLTTDLPVNLIPGDYLVRITDGRTTESILLTVGAVGLDGPVGPQGETGAQGDAGTDGQPGPQGNPGQPGPQGEQGVAGLDGAEGPAGQLEL